LMVDAGQSTLAPNGGPEQHGIANDIMSLGHPTNWNRHFINIVFILIVNNQITL
jgi:hypothetical protein